MLSPKLEHFLEKQKIRMLKIDETEDKFDKNVPHYLDAAGNLHTGMELLYNNTISWLNSKEALSALGEEFQQLEVLQEDTVSAPTQTWTFGMLPLIRRLYHNIVARELVSIQPVSTPTNYIYWLNKVYTNTHAGSGVVAGTRLDNQQISQYSIAGEQATIREIQMSLQRKSIEVHSDKLAADFTLESEQDWQSQFKINVEGELTSELVDEVQREIDRRLFATLLAGTGHQINWYPTAYRSGDINISTHRKSYEEEIYGALIDAQAWIMANKRGVLADSGVEWNVVMSSTTWARFAKLEQYNLTNLSVSTKTEIGRRYVGIINSLFKVYLTEEIDDCSILLTAKSGWLLSPAVYCPYLPLYISPKYIVGADFTTFRRGVMSRQYYGIVPEVPPSGTTTNLAVLINMCQS